MFAQAVSYMFSDSYYQLARDLIGGRKGGREGGRDGRGREAITCSLHSIADGSCDIILPLTESELHGRHVPETNT